MTVALISTGGTIAMQGRHAYDWVDYAESGVIRGPGEILAELGAALPPVELEVVPFRSLGSTGIGVDDWLALRAAVAGLAARADVAGVVVTHGTATLEETAWFLALTVETEKPIVLVGAQRPANTVGSDAGPNLRGALLVAQSAAARGLGVLVAMDGKLFDARSVTKTSNHDLDAFESPEYGPLGRILSDGRVLVRRRPAPLPSAHPWSGRVVDALPRVDVVSSYAGSDGTAVRAFVAAGARGIVCAGLPPGRPANREREALREAARGGVAVVLSSRALRGPVEPASDARRDGFLSASDLGPHKTRILLMLALAAEPDASALQAILDRY